MAARYALPGAPEALSRGWRERLRALLAERSVRLSLAALALVLLDLAGLPLPVLVVVAARWVLALVGAVLGFRLLRVTLRRLLWRIRSKLLLSYLFIAVVPLVLLTLFFAVAGLFFSGLVASHMVAAEVDRLGEALDHAAEDALAGVSLQDPKLAAALAERLAPLRARHSGLAYRLVRSGRTLAQAGRDVPESLPPWWKGPGFVGIVDKQPGLALRAVRARDGGFLTVDVPLDRQALDAFEKRTGVHMLGVGGAGHARGGLQVGVDTRDDARAPGPRGTAPAAADRIAGPVFFTVAEKTVWASGARVPVPLTFYYRPAEFVRRLSPGRIDTADVLVTAMTVLGAIFLVVYAAALTIGLALARSITGSVHALSIGTVRLRQGDFDHPIPIRSRDQLGELAESFNLMARGIQELLREQAEKQRLEEELRIARQIQMSLLPRHDVTLPGVRVAALCLPAAEVGGDYYDLLPLSPTQMGVVVADVSGKGTSAALYMAELKGLMLSLSRACPQPGRLLAQANRILESTMDARSFVTMTYAVVDTSSRRMRYARAGHSPILYYEAATRTARALTPPGLGLGIASGERFEAILEERELALAPGDALVFFTDGLSEAMNGRAELYGEARLREVVERSGGLPSEQIKERVLDAVRSFVDGAAQHDDMTLVVLKVS